MLFQANGMCKFSEETQVGEDRLILVKKDGFCSSLGEISSQTTSSGPLIAENDRDLTSTILSSLFRKTQYKITIESSYWKDIYMIIQFDLILIIKMSMHYLQQTHAQKKEMKENFLMRILFKAYFPTDTFNHLHQTANHLLLKVLSTQAHMLKLNPYLYIDQSIANQSLQYRIERFCTNLREGKYDNHKLIDTIQHTLLYSDKKGIEKIPYFLK